VEQLASAISLLQEMAEVSGPFNHQRPGVTLSWSFRNRVVDKIEVGLSNRRFSRRTVLRCYVEPNSGKKEYSWCPIRRDRESFRRLGSASDFEDDGHGAGKATWLPKG
jgi:hypothetical protein